MFEITRENCKNLTMTIGERVKEAREAAGYTQAQLAGLLNIKQQSIQQIETGNTQRPKKINEIASILGVTVEFLLNEQENIVDFVYPLVARCPLISWEEAVDWPANKSYLKNENKLKYIGGEVILNGNCYMLEIEDNSMVSFMEAKGFHQGRHIIIDPTKNYKDGNYIVAKKNNLSKLLFRQYINDGESEYLNPLNISHYKRMDLTDKVKICGVVVAYIDIFS